MFKKETLDLFEDQRYSSNITIRYENGTVSKSMSYGAVQVEDTGTGILLTYLNRSKQFVRLFVPSTTIIEIITENALE